MRKVLMLDVDGVIVRPTNVRARAWSDTLEADLGLAKSTLSEKFFKPHWNEIVTGQRALMPLLQRALNGTGVDASALRDYWFSQDARVVEDVLEDVIHARHSGWTVFLATNQEHERAEYLMDVVRLREHFDGIFYSASLGAKKPELGFFERTGEEDALLVDDTVANVEAARHFGWRAHLWSEGQRLCNVLDQDSGRQ